jgi:hypothetical protein
MTPERIPPPLDYTALLGAYDRAWQQFQANPSPDAIRLLQTGEELLLREFAKPGRFELGSTVATPGSLTAIEAAGHHPVEFLLRHKRGDWGQLDPEDRRENERALRQGSRLLSAYSTRLQERLWVITEWDRSATTLLLPEEY